MLKKQGAFCMLLAAWLSGPTVVAKGQAESEQLVPIGSVAEHKGPVKNGETDTVPAGQGNVQKEDTSELLLKLIEKAIADDGFRRKLEQLCRLKQKRDLEDCRELARMQNLLLRELRSSSAAVQKENEKLAKNNAQLAQQNKDLIEQIADITAEGPDGLTLPVKLPEVPGTIKIDNRCSYPVEIRIAGKLYSFGPNPLGRPYEVSQKVPQKGGEVIVELIGEGPKKWVLSPPAYETKITVVPRYFSGIVLPDAHNRVRTAFRPVFAVE
ncbi:MAG: hypothetical protein HQ567_04170 [Candidatus Nealsonbacteria bacterium]|nr:hypothetical protein [Candidatus Nealsonbacteria bacterium]